MRLSKALKEKLNDVRLRDKLIAEGKITKQQVDEYMKALPDETDKASWTEVEEQED